MEYYEREELPLYSPGGCPSGFLSSGPPGDDPYGGDGYGSHRKGPDGGPSGCVPQQWWFA